MPNIASINGIAEDNISHHNGGTASLYTSKNGDTWVHEVTTSSSASEWNGATSSFTFSGSNITCNGSGNKSIRTNDSFTGDVRLEFTATETGVTMGFGFYEIDEDGTFSSTSGRGGMASMTDSWHWHEEGTDYVWYGSSNLGGTNVDISDGDTVKLERVSGVIKLYVEDSLDHTFSQTSSNEIRICFSVDGPSSSDIYTGVTWTV